MRILVPVPRRKASILAKLKNKNLEMKTTLRPSYDPQTLAEKENPSP